MRLRDLLDESVVKVGLDNVDKEACIMEMVDLLVRSGRIANPKAALEAIHVREAAGTTGIGNGCAVPHGTHPVISGVHVVVGTSVKGVDFNAVDGDPVRLAFMILAGSGEPESLVFTLFEVARLLKTPGVYGRLIQAPSPSALLDIIDAEEQPTE